MDDNKILLTAYAKLDAVMRMNIDNYHDYFTEHKVAGNSSQRQIVTVYITALHHAGVITADEWKALCDYTKADKKYEGVNLKGQYLYWPCGKCNSETFPNLFTYSAALSYDEALRQFSIWEFNFGVTEAWIDVCKDGEKIARLEVKKTWKVKEN